MAHTRSIVDAMVRLKGDGSGNVAIIFAITLPILMGAAGLGVETSYWYFRSLQLQSSADAAAFAGELEKLAGSDFDTIEATAQESAVSNGFEVATGEIEVSTPPSSGPNTAQNAVEVILEQTLPRYFTAMFSDEPLALKARAVARGTVASKACLLALNPSASKAVLFAGSTDLKLTACAVMSNSTAADAVKVQGSAKVAVSCLISAGGIDLGGTLTTTCASQLTHVLPASDPFASLPTPAATSPCKSTSGSPLQPGTYCSGLTLKNTVALNAGVYVIQGGDLKVNANAIVTGTGVTIYLDCGSKVSMNGTAKVQLSAPTTGAYSGILFYGDRACTSGSNTFNGTADSLLTGALYFAQQDVNYLGNFSGAGGCSQVVAGTIQWSGSSTIKQDCTSLGMAEIPANQSVQLVE